MYPLLVISKSNQYNFLVFKDLSKSEQLIGDSIN